MYFWYPSFPSRNINTQVFGQQYCVICNVQCSPGKPQVLAYMRITTPGNVPLRSLMSVLFWPHKGNQHNVKQVVLMTCRNLPEISLFSTSATQHVLRLLFHPNESIAPWETAISLKGTNNLALQKTSRYLYAKPWRRVWATAAVKGKTVKFQFAGSAACSSGFSFLFWDELLTGHEGEGGKAISLLWCSCI